MPLLKLRSDKARTKNIRELIHAGRDPKQAAAIAYDVQRKAMGSAIKKRRKRK